MQFEFILEYDKTCTSTKCFTNQKNEGATMSDFKNKNKNEQNKDMSNKSQNREQCNDSKTCSEGEKHQKGTMSNQGGSQGSHMNQGNQGKNTQGNASKGNQSYGHSQHSGQKENKKNDDKNCTETDNDCHRNKNCK